MPDRVRRQARARLQRQDEETRLRRLRGGTITAAVGFGLILAFLILSFINSDFVLFIGPSLLVFLIGLGVVINGLYFTLPKGLKPAGKTDYELTGESEPKVFSMPEPPPFQHLSVVENTTRNLVESEKRDTNKIKQKSFYEE